MADYDTNIERKSKMHKHVVNTFAQQAPNRRLLFAHCWTMVIWFFYIFFFVKILYFTYVCEFHWMETTGQTTNNTDFQLSTEEAEEEEEEK